MADLFKTIPTGDAITYLNTVIEALPTRIAEPINAAAAHLLPANPQAPMSAQAPAPLAVVDPSTVREAMVVETPKAKTNAWLIGGLLVGGLALLALRKR